MLYSTQKKIVLTAKAVHNTRNYGAFEVRVFKNPETYDEHLVLSRGNIKQGYGIKCRIASECLPGTAFNSNDCDCKDQLDESLRIIDRVRKGLIIYLKQEGRGHGLSTKIQALAYKNKGLDTFEAVRMLGVEPDIRTYTDAAYILNYLEVQSVDLLTNNPTKTESLKECGVVVSKQVPLIVKTTTGNIKHLRAKIERGHTIFVEGKCTLQAKVPPK